MQNSKIYNYALAALFTALTAIFSLISIPLPFTPVPVNLATLAVMLSGLLLGAKYGVISQLVYIFIGVIGIPVFSGGNSGPGALFGPTGGYIAGYVLCSLCCGLMGRIGQGRGRAENLAFTISAMILGTALCYTAGTIWFIRITGTGIAAALISCVVPFIPGDIIKMIAAEMIARRLRPIVYRK